MSRRMALWAPVLLAAGLSACSGTPAPTEPVQAVSEDSADFDCRIHGNRTCGFAVDTPQGPAAYSVTFDADGTVASVERMEHMDDAW